MSAYTGFAYPTLTITSPSADYGSDEVNGHLYARRVRLRARNFEFGTSATRIICRVAVSEPSLACEWWLQRRLCQLREGPPSWDACLLVLVHVCLLRLPGLLEPLQAELGQQKYTAQLR